MHMQTERSAPPKRKKATSKLIAGLTAFLATGIITVSGMAGATPDNGNGNGNGNGNKPGNKHHNGQMVHSNQSGTISHGYGGGNTSIINNISVNVNGNNNIIQVIVNIFR
ncbi:MAG: hypothetical protein ACREGD_00735 [Candidatus Saccharimonadales bacterium]